MRRAKALIELSRRDFCGFVCLGAAFVAGCTDGETGAIQTGGLNGSDGTLPPDGSVGQTDGGTSGDAGTMAGACSGANTDVGPASQFLANKPMKFTSPSVFFVMRDANGLYALTARCTHEGVTVQDTGSQYYCPSHGARFTYNGAVISGPTSTPLKHYAMCTLPNGHVGVQTSITVSASTRLVA